MTDDFVRRAFEEAYENIPFDDPEEEAEYQAYRKAIVEDCKCIFNHVGEVVGLDKTNRLSKVVIESGEAKTFAEFANVLLSLGFSIGYGEGKKNTK